jgi:hypothetical protein
MLNISSLLGLAASMRVALERAGVAKRLDIPNDRASRPIPVAEIR